MVWVPELVPLVECTTATTRALQSRTNLCENKSASRSEWTIRFPHDRKDLWTWYTCEKSVVAASFVDTKSRPTRIPKSQLRFAGNIVDFERVVNRLNVGVSVAHAESEVARIVVAVHVEAVDAYVVVVTTSASEAASVVPDEESIAARSSGSIVCIAAAVDAHVAAAVAVFVAAVSAAAIFAAAPLEEIEADLERFAGLNTVENSRLDSAARVEDTAAAADTVVVFAVDIESVVLVEVARLVSAVELSAVVGPIAPAAAASCAVEPVERLTAVAAAEEVSEPVAIASALDFASAYPY